MVDNEHLKCTATLPTIFKRNFDVCLIFKNSNTIRKILIKNSPVEEFNGCVYEIPCNNCDRFYVGQAGKNLEKRTKQRKYSVRTGQESSAVFCHVRDKNHVIDFDSTRIIMKCRDYHDRKIIKSAIIRNVSIKTSISVRAFIPWTHLPLTK